MADRRFVYQTFVPAETASITGVSPENQRNLRRLGHMEAVGDGWNRIPAHDLAMYLCINELGRFGIPPGQSKKVAAFAAQRIIIFALKFDGAVTNAAGEPVAEPPIKTPAEFEQRFLIALRETETPNGEVTTFARNDLSEILENPGFSDEDLATAVILDLERLGRILARRAGRPLAIFN